MNRLPRDVAEHIATYLVPRAEERGQLLIPDAQRREELFRRFYAPQEELSSFELAFIFAALKREVTTAMYRSVEERRAVHTLASLRCASRSAAATWGSVAQRFRDAVASKAFDDVTVEGREAIVLWRLTRTSPGETSAEAAQLLATLKSNCCVEYHVIKLGLARARQILLRPPGPDDATAACARKLAAFCKTHPRHLVQRSHRSCWTVGKQLLHLRLSQIPRDRAEAEAALRDLGYL